MHNGTLHNKCNEVSNELKEFYHIKTHKNILFTIINQTKYLYNTERPQLVVSDNMSGAERHPRVVSDNMSGAERSPSEVSANMPAAERFPPEVSANMPALETSP